MRVISFIYRHRRWLKRLIPIRGPVLVRLPEFRIYVRLDDWAVGARIAARRRYEPHVSAVFRDLLTPDMVVVDVGANLGYYTLLAASRIGFNGKVIAFEPGSDSCALLRRSLEANGFSNAAVHPLAVADMDGIVGYDMDDSNGRISLADPTSSRFQVRSVVLDTFLAQEPRVDLLKIDIEGGEGRALKGMRALLRKHRPLLLSEFCPGALELASNMTGAAYLKELRSLDYDLHLIRSASGVGPPCGDDEILGSVAAGDVSAHLDLLAKPRIDPH